MYFTIYTSEQITRIIERPDFVLEALDLAPDEMFVDAYLPFESYYVVNNDIAPRPNFPIHHPTSILIADGESTLSFSNVPVGTVVSVDDQSIVVNDGEFRFSTDTAGEYEIKFTLFPYKDLTINVTAIDPA